MACPAGMFQVILVADYCIDSALFSIMIFDTFSNLVGAIIEKQTRIIGLIQVYISKCLKVFGFSVLDFPIILRAFAKVNEFPGRGF